MSAKKVGVSLASADVSRHDEAKKNYSIRLPEEDAARIRAIAEHHDWTIAKTIQKLVKAALDARLLK